MAQHKHLLVDFLVFKCLIDGKARRWCADRKEKEFVPCRRSDAGRRLRLLAAGKTAKSYGLFTIRRYMCNQAAHNISAPLTL